MMKKLLILCLICNFISPVYAQRGFGRGVKHGKKPAARHYTLRKEVHRTTTRSAARSIEDMTRSIGLDDMLRYTQRAMLASERTDSQVERAKKTLHIQEKIPFLKRLIWRKKTVQLPVSGPRIQITNLPGEPTVKLGRATDDMPAMLSARLLTGEENFHLIFPDMPRYSVHYLPSSLNTEEEVGYRGLKLYNLESVKNILENGLEWKRGGYNGKIFFTGNLNRVTDFVTEHTDRNLLPTIVKFNLPEDRRFMYTRVSLFNVDYYLWLENIWSYYIQDVMVFLEVNGKPGWYKATLENGELVFTPVPSRVFNTKEFIIHNFEIPEHNMDLY